MPSDFIISLQNHDIESIRNCPKSDLHNHSFLGGNVRYIEQTYHVQIPRLDHKFQSMEEMHQWVGQYIHPLFSEDAEEGLFGKFCLASQEDT